MLYVTLMLDIMLPMGDKIPTSPDHRCLFDVASEQHGYFTAEQAHACDFRRYMLTHHTQQGRFIRIRRGLYRLRDYPSSPREGVVVAWLAVGKKIAVVSHESALDLLGLSDAIPQAVHITVPRSKRHLPVLSGVAIHTTTRPLGMQDATFRNGIRLTTATRTILDCAEAGTAPEQVELAITQAVERGLVTEETLRQQSLSRGGRVAKIIASALERVRA